MIEELIVFFLALLGVLVAAVVALLSYIVLKLMKKELNLKIDIRVDDKKPKNT